jgi:predicted nucleic acid-binding Zn ribbon protein
MTEQLYDTLTKSEIDQARGNGNGHAPSVVLERQCEHCSKPLSPTQKRACSNRCARMLGAKRNRSAAAERRKRPPLNKATTLGDLLAVLPAEVSAVELNNGWRCTRV